MEWCDEAAVAHWTQESSETSILGGSTPQAPRVGTPIESESSFGSPAEKSIPPAAHPIQERTAVQMMMW
jgi:hypothetical protein